MKISIIVDSVGLGHVDAAYFEAIDQRSSDLLDLAREFGARGLDVTVYSGGGRAEGVLRGVRHQRLEALVAGLEADLVISGTSFSRAMSSDLFGPTAGHLVLMGPGEHLGLFDDATYASVADIGSLACLTASGFPVDHVCLQARQIADEFTSSLRPGPDNLAPHITFVIASSTGASASLSVEQRLRAEGYEGQSSIVDVSKRLGLEASASTAAPMAIIAPSNRGSWVEILAHTTLLVCLDETVVFSTSVCQEAMATLKPLVAVETADAVRMLGDTVAYIPATAGVFDLGVAVSVLQRLLTPSEDEKRALASKTERARAVALQGSVGRTVDRIGKLLEVDLGQKSNIITPAGRSIVTRDFAAPRVVVMGRFSFTGGYGSIVNYYEAALRSTDIEYVCFDTMKGAIVGPARGAFWRYDEKASSLTVEGPTLTLVCDTAPQFAKVEASGATRVVGITLFETHSFPAAWLPHFDHVDEVWVPTEFNMNTFARAGIPQTKLRQVPYPVDAEYFSENGEPVRLAPEETTTFLYTMANFSRKDVGLLIRSFLLEFENDCDVHLIIKVVSNNESVIAQIEDAVGFGFNLGASADKITLMQGNLSNDQLRALFHGVDVYVSTERAKGWDYPAMEALACAKPVVAIDWSGSTEFLSEDNSYLIPARHLITADPRLMVNTELYLGQAYPDIAVKDVRAALRRAHDDKDGRATKGLAGQELVLSKYGLRPLGHHLEELLNSYGPLSFRGSGNPVISVKPFDSVSKTSAQARRS